MQQESTSSGEMEADGKATSSNGHSSSETSPTVSEDKSQFCRLSIPKGDKLKEMLTSLWESDGSLKTRMSAASAFRNSKVSVDEAVADSTEFEADSAPPSSSGSSFNRGENKNKLLLSLLQGSQPMLGSVLNVGNISAVATVTPQMIMAKKSELAGLTARIPDVRFTRDSSTTGSSSNLPDPEQAMKKASTGTTSSGVSTPVVGGQPSDAVSWPHSKTSMDNTQQNCPAVSLQSPVAQQSLIADKLYRDISDSDLNLLQECLSQNGSFDSPMTPYVDKLLDEVCWRIILGEIHAQYLRISWLDNIAMVIGLSGYDPLCTVHIFFITYIFPYRKQDRLTSEETIDYCRHIVIIIGVARIPK